MAASDEAPRRSLVAEFDRLKWNTSNEDLFDLGRMVALEFARRSDNYLDAIEGNDPVEAGLLLEARRFVEKARLSFVVTSSEDDDVREASYRLLDALDDLRRHEQRVAA